MRWLSSCQCPHRIPAPRRTPRTGFPPRRSRSLRGGSARGRGRAQPDCFPRRRGTCSGAWAGRPPADLPPAVPCRGSAPDKSSGRQPWQAETASPPDGGAARSATQPLAHRPSPTPSDRDPFESLQIGNDRRAHRVRRFLHRHVHLLNDEVVVDGQSDPHVVNGVAGRDVSAPTGREAIVLGVTKVPLDVPKTVLASVAAANQLAAVQGGAGFGFRQGHCGVLR